MTDRLERCPTPWCGPEHEKYTWQGPDDLYCVICDGCQVEGPRKETEAEAITAWNTRTTSLAAQDKQVLALVEAARDAGDVLQSAATPSNLDPQFSGQIAALGERIGYGALMHGASALWRKSLGDLAGGEFAAGPCVSTAASRLARLDDALMPFRGETLPATPSLAAQDGLDEHFPTGLRQRPMRLATTDEVFEGPVFCDCYCGESFAGSDEQEVRQLWAEHALSAIKEQHHD